MKYTAIVAAALCTVILGCKQSPSGWGVRTISSSTATPGEAPVDGIDRYSANFWTLGDEWAVCLWTTATGGSYSAGWDPDRKSIVYSGAFPDDGKRIDVRCHTADGRAGTMKIGTRSFDLADGTLFLTKTSGPDLEVRQLRRNRDELRMNAEFLKTLTRTDQEIREFYGAPAPPH